MQYDDSKHSHLFRVLSKLKSLRYYPKTLKYGCEKYSDFEAIFQHLQILSRYLQPRVQTIDAQRFFLGTLCDVKGLFCKTIRLEAPKIMVLYIWLYHILYVQIRYRADVRGIPSAQNNACIILNSMNGYCTLYRQPLKNPGTWEPEWRVHFVRFARQNALSPVEIY